MKKKQIISLLMASVMTLSFTACGSKPAEADNPAEESTEDGGS